MAEKPVGRLRLFGRFWGWWALLPLLFGAVFTAITMFEGRKAQRLETGGLDGQAQILEKWVERKRDSDGDITRIYKLSYRFEAGNMMEGEDSVSRRFYNSVQAGQQVPIRYWGKDPDVHEIEPGATGKQIWIVKIIAIVTLTAGGALFFIAWQGSARALAVREHGTRRKARVTGLKTTNVKVNNRPMYRLTWLDSQSKPGQSFMAREQKFDAYPEGAEIWIYADPRGRRKPVWEGDVGPSRGRQ